MDVSLNLECGDEDRPVCIIALIYLFLCSDILRGQTTYLITNPSPCGSFVGLCYLGALQNHQWTVNDCLAISWVSSPPKFLRNTVHKTEATVRLALSLSSFFTSGCDSLMQNRVHDTAPLVILLWDNANVGKIGNSQLRTLTLFVLMGSMGRSIHGIVLEDAPGAVIMIL
ncbi:hypothetical protein B0H21DRAFT_371227 [Amylocystis lapponica]|nr:hypothetical protein B0H21DRAFT_371227 [Amylocystis lapponica]